MSERLAAAQTALNAGRGAEAIEHLEAAIAEDPARPAQVYRVLVLQLYHAGRNEEGAAWSAKTLERYPKDLDVWNLRGVLLRRLRRYPEAIAAFDEALKLSPKLEAAQSNRGNVLIDMGEFARAEAIFTKLARANPRNAEFQRQLGRSLMKLGRVDQGLMRLRQAVSLKRDLIDGWLDMAGYYNEDSRTDEAAEIIERALVANPDDARLVEARAVVMRRAGQMRRADAYLQSFLPRLEAAAWLHHQIALTCADYDRERANVYFRKAVALAPDKLDYRIALVESLERTRTGNEGANIEEAYQLARPVMANHSAELTSGHKKVLYEVFVRVSDFDAMASLGGFEHLGREWAEGGRHTALLKQLPRVRSHEDRLELLEQHRIWGRSVETQAARTPITHPAPRAADGKIRLGFMSSDLRNHPVGYFALPLFEHIDRSRFDVYVYSYYQGEQADRLQQFITGQVTAFRWWPDISIRDAAQAIAADELDMLIELGGSTHMNKLDVMAFRPARLQASWLGYPHSAGLSTIDYLVVDPYVMPSDPKLLIEQPMMLSHAWYPLASATFRDDQPIELEPPLARNGHVTFGTANNPQKYTPEVIETWARVMQRTPGSHFLFIRPEGDAPSFRQNLTARFAAAGVSADRIEFEPVRGKHLPHYNRCDITLDPFPQTGGTTTCESLWMGAPCVTLVGESVFERLSYSVLTNVGLGELCAATQDEYVDIAAQLAADPARIAALRAGMRTRMRNSPLGQTKAWADDFYATVARTVAGERLSA
jgi:protein O-GlcNAc transferase